MGEKQKLIIDVAQKLFDNKGLQFTSIEDIVKECKISKTTFYKYFATKEDLMSGIWEYSNNKFLSDVKEIEDNKEIDLKEKLKRKIILMWDHVAFSSSFNNYLTKRFTEVKEQSISKMRKEVRNSILEGYHDALIKIYGNKIEKIIWELIFLLDSLINEFVLITRIHEKKLEKDFVADYIIRTLEIHIKNLKDNVPIIEKNIFFEGEIEKDNSYSSEKALFFHGVKNIKELINNNYDLKGQKRLMQAVNNIEKEAQSEGYDSLIMDAMICFLEKESILKAEARIIYKLKNKIGGM